MYSALLFRNDAKVQKGDWRPLIASRSRTVHLQKVDLSKLKAFADDTFNPYPTVYDHVFFYYGECRARSACTYVQSDLALHSLLLCQ